MVARGSKHIHVFLMLYRPCVVVSKLYVQSLHVIIVDGLVVTMKNVSM